jgi:hypothetical protein
MQPVYLEICGHLSSSDDVGDKLENELARWNGVCAYEEESHSMFFDTIILHVLWSFYSVIRICMMMSIYDCLVEMFTLFRM